MKNREEKNKLENVSKEIKGKLSLSKYKTEVPNASMTEAQQHIIPSTHNDSTTETHNDSNVEDKKVKCTFYISQKTYDRYCDYFYKQLSRNRRLTKSDVISQAIEDYISKEEEST